RCPPYDVVAPAGVLDAILPSISSTKVLQSGHMIRTEMPPVRFDVPRGHPPVHVAASTAIADAEFRRSARHDSSLSLALLASAHLRHVGPNGSKRSGDEKRMRIGFFSPPFKARHLWTYIPTMLSWRSTRNG